MFLKLKLHDNASMLGLSFAPGNTIGENFDDSTVSGKMIDRYFGNFTSRTPPPPPPPPLPLLF